MFTKKNELGIDYECYVIANVIYNKGKYIIYTDFVNDIEGNFRLFVASLENNHLITSIDEEIEKKIIEGFKKYENDLLKVVMEVQNEI